MKHIAIFLVLILAPISCTEDSDFAPNPFVIAFQKQFTNYANLQGEHTIDLVFSENATASGYVKIGIESTHVSYGLDFETLPEAENNTLIMPFEKGSSSIHFTIKNLKNHFTKEDQEDQIKFIIKEINYRDLTSIQGQSQHLISFSSSLGGVVAPNVGGPNEPNQVYIDLSTGESLSIRRDSWDLGFYGGDDFRVILNGSLYMATKALDTDNIDAVNTQNIPANYFKEVKIGTFDPENKEYIDNPNGSLSGTAIQEIEVNPSDNPVYLVNLGSEVGTETPNTGTVAVSGKERGWKKIRVLRQQNGYLLQYADLDETTHKEIMIPKESNYHFTHFSFNAQEHLLKAQPPKGQWDLCFTVFTNLVTTNNGDPAGSYGFSDFVVNNILANSQAFMVIETQEQTYENYTLDVDQAKLTLSNDQRAIGAEWRDVFKGLKTDRFFVLNDTDGNWYKIKFIAFTNAQGKRGYPKFQYEQITKY